MKMAFLAALAAFALSGCVTAEEMAARNASADDSSCQSYGTAPGSSAYFTCRMTKDQTRTYLSQIQAEEAQANLNRSLCTLANSAYPGRPVNC